jgi:predicted nicotinamide N-methyase
MGQPSPANLRAFVRRHTTLVAVPGLSGVVLHVASDVTELWHACGSELGLADPPLPFWAFPWAGGLAVARHLADHPEEVAGRRVLDLASGSGLCAIAALRAGAGSVQAVDVDPLAEAAVTVNARANALHVPVRRTDLLGGPPPDADVVLAGDVCYEEAMAERMLAWLAAAAADGRRVLVGDPGRRYLPAGLRRVASYEVITSRELERAELTAAGVFTFETG